MLFKHKRLALLCRKCVHHFQEYYKQYCKLCNNLVCAQCIASNEHDGHTLLDIAENFNSKTAVLKRDLAELQNIIYPMYKKIELEISFQKIDIDKNSKNLKTALIKHGDDMRRGINMIFNKLTSDLDNTTSEHMLILSDEEYKITQTIFEIKETINYMKTTVHWIPMTFATSLCLSPEMLNSGDFLIHSKFHSSKDL